MCKNCNYTEKYVNLHILTLYGRCYFTTILNKVLHFYEAELLLSFSWNQINVIKTIFCKIVSSLQLRKKTIATNNVKSFNSQQNCLLSPSQNKTSKNEVKTFPCTNPTQFAISDRFSYLLAKSQSFAPLPLPCLSKPRGWFSILRAYLCLCS